jgi:predicted RNase H-like HicB family nuclease
MTALTIVDHYHFSAGWCEGPGCYVATCAEFQGLTTQSDTAEHAIKLLKETVRDIVAGMYETGEDVPEPVIAPPFEDCT